LFVADSPKVFNHNSSALMADKKGTSLGQTLPVSLYHRQLDSGTRQSS